MPIGVVREIWRYPVKSMGGERLQQTALDHLGVPGDRGWALRDETVGEIRGGKKLPILMQCRARYRAEPAGDTIPHADIELPDGTRTATDDATIATSLSELCGRPVTLWPRRPAEDREHYRRVLPEPEAFEQDLRDIFGRLPDEPLPDLAALPAEILEFTSPLGTYFDAFPLHVLTSASLATLRAAAPGSDFDPRRFRPNVLIESAAESSGLPEVEWSGRTLTIGDAALRCEMQAVRCSMTMRAQPGLPADPQVLRTIVRDGKQHLGAYASVLRAGTIRVGDAVTLD